MKKIAKILFLSASLFCTTACSDFLDQTAPSEQPGENVFELLKYYDGVSVATWIKNGDMRNPIDPARAKQFLDGCKKAQQWREEHRGDNL